MPKTLNHSFLLSYNKIWSSVISIGENRVEKWYTAYSCKSITIENKIDIEDESTGDIETEED